MGRLVPLLLGLVVFLNACAGGTLPQVPVPIRPVSDSIAGLNIRYDLLAQLAYIQEEFERETVWCLTGWVVGGFVHVNGIAPAIVKARGPMSAEFVSCNDPGVIGFHHNHPRNEWDNCGISEPDVYILEHVPAFLVSLVSCNDGGFVYRFRGENRIYWLGRISDPPAVATPQGG